MKGWPNRLFSGEFISLRHFLHTALSGVISTVGFFPDELSIIAKDEEADLFFAGITSMETM
jgi:hypothetical protein